MPDQTKPRFRKIDGVATTNGQTQEGWEFDLWGRWMLHYLHYPKDDIVYFGFRKQMLVRSDSKK